MPTVRGFAKLSDGTFYPNATFTFTRSPRAIVAQSSAVVTPGHVTVTSGAGGDVEFDLLAGNYIGEESSTGIKFNFLMPDADAFFQDCLSAATVTPWPEAVQAAIDARDDAVATAIGFATHADFVAWEATSSPTVGQTVNVNGLPVAYLNLGPDFTDVPGWVPTAAVSLRYFGAEGDNTASTGDSTTAFEDAAEYIAAAEYSNSQGRRALYVGGGQFNLTSTITWAENFTRIIGEGSRATTIASLEDIGDFFKFSAADPTTTTQFGCGVSGLAFRSFADTTSGAHLRFTRNSVTRLADIVSDDHFGGLLFEGGLDIHANSIHVFSGRNSLWGAVKTGSYGIQIKEGPATQQGLPADFFFANVNIRCADGSAYPWLDKGIDVRACDGLWLSNWHVLGCGGVDGGGLYIKPETTVLSPDGTQVTWIKSSNGSCDNANSNGIRIAGTTAKGFGDFTFADHKFLGAGKHHGWIEDGCNVVGVKVDGHRTNRSGRDAFMIAGGASVEILNGTISESGSDLVSGERSGVVITGTAQHVTVKGNKFVNETGSNQTHGVRVLNGAVDFVDVSGNTFVGMNSDVDDDFSVGNTGTGTKNYRPNYTTRTTFNTATSSNSLQPSASGDFWICDTSTADVIGIVRRFLGAVRGFQVNSTRWFRHNGASSTGLSLKGGVDYQANAGDILWFQYVGGARGWLEIHRLAIDSVMLAGDQTVSGAKSFTGFLGLGAPSTLTIASGAITATASNHLIDTESAAATDDLVTINGGADGAILVIGTVSNARDVVIKNGTGNVFCGADITLDSTDDRVTLIKRGSNWFDIGLGADTSELEALVAAAAVSAEDAASAAAAAIAGADGYYPDTATGLAAVPLGGYFAVPVSGSYDAAILYREDAGPVATEVVRMPSSTLVAETRTLAARCAASVSDFSVAAAATTVTGSYLDKDTGLAVVLSGAISKTWAINPSEAIKSTAALSGIETALAIWYDAGGVYIGYSVGGPLSGLDSYTDHVLVAPANAAFVGMSQTAAAAASLPMSVARGTQIYTLPSRVSVAETSLAGLPAITTTLAEYTSVAGASIVTGSYIKRTDGSFNSGFAAYNYQLFTVIPGETIRVSAKIDGAFVALAVWYNSGGTFLSYSVNAAASPPGDVYRDYELVVPAGAVTMGMCCRITDQASNPMTVKRAALAEDMATRVAALEAGTGAANPYWATKSVVWFGNSIPTGTATGGMYPDQLASLLGFALSKETTNGMQFRYGRTSLISGPDPYGLTGRNWSGVLYALGGTLVEKQYLIDNWATVRLLLSGSPPATLTSTQQADALDTSYENRLVARHLGANRKDWYIFDNPYNDYDKTVGDAIDTDGAGTETRGTYLGVMNFLIRKIREDNPAAKIAIVGHFENQRYPIYEAAQQAVADYWSIPIMPLWDSLGWSQRDITVDGSWGGVSPTFTWAAGTGAQTLTTLARIVPDLVHPGYDTSGEPIAKITSVLGEWMRALR